MPRECASTPSRSARITRVHGRTVAFNINAKLSSDGSEIWRRSLSGYRPRMIRPDEEKKICREGLSNHPERVEVFMIQGEDRDYGDRRASQDHPPAQGRLPIMKLAAIADAVPEIAKLKKESDKDVGTKFRDAYFKGEWEELVMGGYLRYCSGRQGSGAYLEFQAET
jgi:hypothetical protein